MALYGNKVSFGTSDLHVVALDIKTGNVVWDSAVANAGQRWNLTGGPLVAKGKVMQGIGGTRRRVYRGSRFRNRQRNVAFL